MKRVIFVLLIGLSLSGSRIGFCQEKLQAAPADIGSIKVLNLETAQRIALAENPDLTAALARVAQARARVMQAAADWWPELNLTGGASRVRLSENFLQTSGIPANFSFANIDRTQENYTAGLQASWILFDGFYRTFNERQARFAEKSAAAARVDTQRLLISAVAETFLNAQLAQTNMRIAEADRDFYNQQLQDAVNRFDVGAGAWGDVLNIKVQLNTAKTSVLLSSRELEADMYGLAALLGLPDGSFPPQLQLNELDEKPDIEAEQVKPEILIEQALELRPDIRQLTLSIHQAEALIGQAEAAYYPQLRLSGPSMASGKAILPFSGDDFGNTIGLNLSWNLFNGGADRPEYSRRNRPGAKPVIPCLVCAMRSPPRCGRLWSIWRRPGNRCSCNGKVSSWSKKTANWPEMSMKPAKPLWCGSMRRSAI